MLDNNHYSQIFPCFFFGMLSTLFASIRSARITFGRVSRGSHGFIVHAGVRQMDQIARTFGEVRGQLGSLDIFRGPRRPEVPEFFQPPMDLALAQWDAARDSQGKSATRAAGRQWAAKELRKTSATRWRCSAQSKPVGSPNK
jgi:hypothetical protein